MNGFKQVLLVEEYSYLSLCYPLMGMEHGTGSFGPPEATNGQTCVLLAHGTHETLYLVPILD